MTDADKFVHGGQNENNALSICITYWVFGNSDSKEAGSEIQFECTCYSKFRKKSVCLVKHLQDAFPNVSKKYF